MNYSPELTRALETLRQITGITMQVKAETPEEEELALTQIRCICSAYQEKYSRTHFLQGAITGTLSSYEILERAPHFHISVEEPRVLFLIKGKNGFGRICAGGFKKSSSHSAESVSRPIGGRLHRAP